MTSQSKSEPPGSPGSRTVPEPEGTEEIYRRFERLNRRGGSRSLRELAGGAGKKTLYGAFAVVEVAAIVLGFFLEVPYLDTVAIVLPGLLVLLHGGSEGKGTDEAGEETLLERILRRFGDPGAPGDGPRPGDR